MSSSVNFIVHTDIMPPKKIDETQYSIPTQLVYGKSYSEEWDYSHHVIPPITQSSTFRLGSAKRGAEGFDQIGQNSEDRSGKPPIYVYDRMGEPNIDMLQHALATAEGGETAVTFASGMAAVHAAACFALTKNSEIISHKTVYGCTYSLFTNWLPKFGVKSHFADLTTPENILPLINKNSRVLYLESPVNPTLELLDLDAIVNLVKEINKNRSEETKIITVIDNTFATPFAQRPIAHGIDVVVHSLTKAISGFGAVMGGAVVTRREFEEQLILFRKDFGAMILPMTAWTILIYGLSTLPIRLPKQQENAKQIARFLETHPKVAKVRYPGLPSFPQYDIAQRMLVDYDGKFAPGFMIYFALRGKTLEESKVLGEKMMDFVAHNSYSITLAVSLGQLRTLIEHPGSMTHAAYPAEEQVQLGIDPGGIRLAVGIESCDDIIKDLETALAEL